MNDKGKMGMSAGRDDGNTAEEAVRQAPQRRKSARPGKIAYVSMDDLDFNPAAFRGREKGKKNYKKVLKVTGIALLMVFAALGCSYAGITYFYTNHFIQGTSINGYDCSGLTAYEAEQVLADAVENYSIVVSARDQEDQVIYGSDIDYTYISTGEVLELLKEQNPFQWIQGFLHTTSYTVSHETTFDRSLLEAELLSLDCAQEENQVEAENAYVAYNNTEFVIMPETEGSELNVKAAYTVLSEAILNNSSSVDFDTVGEDVYETADVTSDSSQLQTLVNSYNNLTSASITYTIGSETVTLDGSTIESWLSYDEKGQPVTDDAAFESYVATFVAQLAATYDTVGTTRTFTSTSGRTVSVYGSAYGWQIDQASETAQLLEEIQSGTVTTREPVYSMTANSRGTNDLGNTYIEVDLSEQHMYYYQNGSIVFESDFVSGLASNSGRKTPEGIYTLYYKTSPSVLKGDGYEQAVTYWMPFNGGIGFHDATWRSSFGGSIYLTNGSHGCINLPLSSAAELYELITYNVPIICFY
ncbi:MAG: L,D-transpeptidase/peptidoglycan binding protein [Clostridiales bacterium]|nr:L,D-transpeptidase/peptidoglycan binding protein [Clostridiales bacterium]